MGQGAWRDLAHGSSSTGYAKEEGRSHLEDQLDRPLDLNSTGQASTRSSWKSKLGFIPLRKFLRRRMMWNHPWCSPEVTLRLSSSSPSSESATTFSPSSPLLE
ncbi:unnamed protein product [Microthlaspi erraticum]|uniref:Uncharacterized protein n=1 Tax=Microthlaspi erraticum TaxID=1685480 RepID=A0A6D2KT93_9BRAS|nr:unnamed protein product [Microthlaspi erraticum]